MAPRLCAATLDKLADGVRQPGYARDRVRCGIVHLGVGAFMRAHIAVYCEDVLEGGDERWAIEGVSLRRPDVSEQLEPQDGYYLVATRDAAQCDYRLIGALQHMTVAAGAPAAVIDLLARAATRVVTITVTEKGYCLDAHGGGLDANHPDIRHDLAHPGTPRSLLGLLHAACVRRRDTDAGPVTFVSCDNLPGNGDRLQAALLEFAGLEDADIADWIGANVQFPSTMVDRIVPATTTEDIDAAAAATGVYDAGLVCTEPFTQWVIEDRFASGRPHWETAGALLVDDVTPYETAKLRLLNGAHSTLAYLGYLAGFEYVHEVMAEPAMASFLATLMRREISPVTPAPAGMAHDTYIAALLERFGNPALRHRTWQIAMDGSQKLPQRLLGTVREQLSRDGPIASLALATAAWMRYVLGRDEQGEAIDVQDPLAGRFAAVARDTGARSPAAVESLLAIDAIFGDDLRANRRFRQALIAAFDDLVAIGALATVRRFAAAEPGP